MLDDIGLRRAVEQATARPKTAWLCRRTNSHHFGVATWHIEPVGADGLVGLALGNSPSAMPAWGGGTRALFGTNPIAAVFPRRDGLGHGAHRRTECPDGNSAFDNSAGRNYAPDRLSPPRSCPQGRAGGSESF
ncbi:MAG TPA: Ldh family oxidoreductase [Reyranella sp.]|jgi:hypothetical protein|nr:Ldh family oxidoreductase [Reyranella sp.]